MGSVGPGARKGLMKLIPTTATAVEKLKKLANTIKRTEGIPHLAALECAAQQSGYESWFHVQWCLKQTATDDLRQPDQSHTDDQRRFITEAQTYMAYLARKGSVPISRYPTKGDVFHEVEIEGICFRGAVGIDGPAIIRRSARLRGYEQGWVQLGVAEIHFVPQWSPYIAQAQQTTPVGHEWWVCKYGPTEERIKIEDLSPAGRHALAHEFGIVLHHFLRDDDTFDADSDAVHFYSGEWFLFYLSPAFQSLFEWARKHPRKAKDRANSYLGQWSEAAMAGQYDFHSPSASGDALST